ncbi:MAG: TAXI family TRAP transporter solute-binding subunit [Dehalococcoidia bacterium]|nr:TAXI family TRAP transporter solute-binding subunit [Dehalococcoidia bacterium]
MKHKIVMVMLSMALIVSLVLTGCAPKVEKTEVMLYTGGTAGTYFPLGSKYAEMLNKYSDIIDASAVTSGASVTNVKGIEKGESQAGLIQNDVSYYARKGIVMFDTPVLQLQGLATLYPETCQAIVRAESDIYTLADLEGKSVAVGAPGSGCAVGCEQVLEAAGVWDTIKRYDLAIGEGCSALKLGQVDATFVVGATPTAGIEELAVTTPVRLVSVSEEIVDKLHAEGYSFYVRQVIPKGTYKMTEDVVTCAVMAMLCVHRGLPDDVVYDMTKVLFEHLDELRTAHVRAADITLGTALDGMSLILHPGAVKYYEEKGIKVPAELK